MSTIELEVTDSCIDETLFTFGKYCLIRAEWYHAACHFKAYLLDLLASYLVHEEVIQDALKRRGLGKGAQSRITAEGGYELVYEITGDLIGNIFDEDEEQFVEALVNSIGQNLTLLISLTSRFLELREVRDYYHLRLGTYSRNK